MRIAIASRDGQTVSGHIGKCSKWIVYEAILTSDKETLEIEEVERITLAREFIFHHYRDQKPHPLSNCDVVIGKSAGKSFIEKMNRRGIAAVLTSESQAEKAAIDYAQNTLPPPTPRPIGEIICRIHDALSSD